jgi:hypothetical protein
MQLQILLALHCPTMLGEGQLGFWGLISNFKNITVEGEHVVAVQGENVSLRLIDPLLIREFAHGRVVWIKRLFDTIKQTLRRQTADAVRRLEEGQPFIEIYTRCPPLPSACSHARASTALPALILCLVQTAAVLNRR